MAQQHNFLTCVPSPGELAGVCPADFAPGVATGWLPETDIYTFDIDMAMQLFALTFSSIILIFFITMMISAVVRSYRL